jgi:hemerythrin-like metal-binding protein
MALVTWKDIYVVNIEEIDSQHKNLVGIVNELHDAMIIAKGQDVLGKVLDELVEYTLYHFATEEKYFDLYDYPEADLHKKQHKELVEQVAALHEKFKSGERVITLDVMNFLRDWLHDHIVGSDKLFGPYLNSKGLV